MATYIINGQHIMLGFLEEGHIFMPLLYNAQRDELSIKVICSERHKRETWNFMSAQHVLTGRGTLEDHRTLGLHQPVPTPTMYKCSCHNQAYLATCSLQVKEFNAKVHTLLTARTDRRQGGIEAAKMTTNIEVSVC